MVGKTTKWEINGKKRMDDIWDKEGSFIFIGWHGRAMMLPYFWNIYSDKKEFVNQLKLKSGLHPDYWSEKIEIYYFKAAEIPYHAN